MDDRPDTQVIIDQNTEIIELLKAILDEVRQVKGER